MEKIAKIQNAAYNYFKWSYQASYNYSKKVNGVIVDKESHFTFVEDMSLFREKKDIEAYIIRNLKRFKSSGLQSYFEMILALDALSCTFYKTGDYELSSYFSKWSSKLENYDESGFYLDYITEEQLESIYALTN